jgi:hypothetical protein
LADSPYRFPGGRVRVAAAALERLVDCGRTAYDRSLAFDPEILGGRPCPTRRLLPKTGQLDRAEGASRRWPPIPATGVRPGSIWRRPPAPGAGLSDRRGRLRVREFGEEGRFSLASRVALRETIYPLNR